MRNLILAAGILLATVITANAQSNDTRSLDNFSEIKVSQSISVTLIKGNKNEAVITTSGVSADKVLTNIEGSSLRIEMEKGSYRSTRVKVELTYNGELSKIATSSSASLRGIDEITAERMEVKASSSSSIEVVLNVRNLEAAASSSASIKLSGKAKYQDLAVSSSADILAFNLDSEEADIKVSSSARVEITTHGKIKAKASSSGKVVYKGDPEKVIVDTSSSGRVVEY